MCPLFLRIFNILLNIIRTYTDTYDGALQIRFGNTPAKIGVK